MSGYDSILLANLPQLDKQPVLKTSQLPYKLDNSYQPYFRDIIEQNHSECGQITAIAYNFTYEIDRLRGIPAYTASNQYPTHFTYNFMNGGYGWRGVSYIHCFEILRTLGCPTIETYGGIAAGGASRWMDGYQNYFLAMHNRIKGAYQINAGTPEGLDQLKHWLHNHLDGSSVGGVASFYSNAPWNLKTLPDGTPEGGKYVITRWQGLPAHAMTVVGYNDSIRYDYNADGQYTNTLDINYDGVVDMRDWEIGGLLFADGWDGGYNFADSGRCYMMYKTLAEKVYEGGIWNHALHVLDVKHDYAPRLTAKIRMKHTSREFIKVQIGVSNNPEATYPDHLMEFPVFDYQGGEQYMQGGTTEEANKTIEFGLDITPLISYMVPGQDSRIFLYINERDPNNQAGGGIIAFSVIDYTAEPLEYAWEGSYLPLNNDAVTLASVEYTLQEQKVEISTNYLPLAIVGEQYSTQLEQEGGTPPFKWQLLNSYQEEVLSSELQIDGNYMEPDNWDYGTIVYPLPFTYSFYGKQYDTLYIHPDGFVMFEYSQNPWPYLWDERLFIKNTPCIAPFACQKMEFIPAFGHGIWVKEDEDNVYIRWIADIDNSSYSPVVDLSLHLSKNGELSFTYNSSFEAHKIGWSCGVSDGSKKNYFFPELENRAHIDSADAVKIITSPLPEGMNISEDGVFSGLPYTYHQLMPLRFYVEDANRISDVKTLSYSSTDLGVEDRRPKEGMFIESFYPNPCSSMLRIKIKGGQSKQINFIIYDAQGNQINNFTHTASDKANVVQWNGDMMNGNSVPSGIYFIHCRDLSQNHSQVLKVIWQSL